MPELRWNPLLRTYTMVAANRQNRPHMPANWCPFCPGSGKVPDDFDVLMYPNDFPVLSQNPTPVDPLTSNAYHTTEAYGKCEVILYSPKHHAKLYELSLEHVTKLVLLWKERFEFLQQDAKIKYIFPFENRGAEVGVTMPHPHGQLYAYNFVPLKLRTELDSCKAYYAENGKNLWEVMLAEEKADGRRIILENEHFTAFLPHFTDYPFGVFIVSNQQLGTFADFDAATAQSLAQVLIQLTGGFDLIYDRPFPYMMCIHQQPINTEEYADCAAYFRFHIEFYPPLRAKNKIKWYASSEMGAWAAANVVAVEDSAKILREAIERFLNNE